MDGIEDSVPTQSDAFGDANAREAALREILQIISESRDDATPVFETLLRAAQRLFDATNGAIVLAEEGGGPQFLAAQTGASDETLARYESGGFPMDPRESLAARAIVERKTLHFEDVAKGAPYRDGMEAARMHVEKEGIKSSIYVPLISNDRGIGCLNLLHKEQRTYSPDEIALVQSFAAQAVIAIENVRQFHELKTRLEREAATREILEVISESRDDDGPVFDTILDNVSRLCNAPLVFLSIVDASREQLTIPAHRGARSKIAGVWDTMIEPLASSALVSAHAIRDCRAIHVPDLSQDPTFDMTDARRAELVELEDVRSYLVVPLRQGDRAIGTINLYRREVAPFTREQIALVETFASQAVIAIENVRQFRELQTRLEREAATREILHVISQSPDNEKPVFDVILENAAKLCNSSMARLHLLEDGGERRRLVAHWGDALQTLKIGETMPMGLAHPISRTIRECQLIHTEDISQTELYTNGDELFRRLVDEEQLRTLLTVPLIRDGAAFGCIAISRRKVKAFAPDEISLVESFAAQAVIAIENVRQFRELQTRLEREAATREILGAISRSRDDEQPVFDVILRNAARLCNAPMARLELANEARTSFRMAAAWGDESRSFSLGEEFALDLPHITPTSIREGRLIHVHDLADTPEYRAGDEIRTRAVDEEGLRTYLTIPLINNDVGIGCIVLCRREVAPFGEDEIELVRTFAAQAVIAIENVRQFTAIQIANAELKSRLEREAATREILEVISRNRADDTPVFKMILQKAVDLCGAHIAGLNLVSEDGTRLQGIMTSGSVSEIWQDGQYAFSMDDPSTLLVRSVKDQQTIHVRDLAETDSYLDGSSSVRTSLVDDEGVRTWMAVPLVRDGVGIGCFGLFRKEVRPFTEDQIKLVETFAAQAVIAIENVRQFRELQNRLEREAASAEILEVISQSQDDYHAVFDLVAKRARRLCAAKSAWLFLLSQDRQTLEIVSSSGASQELISLFEAEPPPLDDPESSFAKVVSSLALVHEEDVRTTLRYQSETSQRRRAADIEELRTTLHLPLIAAGQCVGVLALHRDQVKAFSEDDIVLLQSFAGQASIALENVRQFKALESRTDEVQALNASLEERVEEQVGEIERMGRLKRFLPAAVADTVVSQGSDKMLSSHRALLGVLFCDIRGFTAFCETAEPEETIEVLQTYHQEMGRLINDHGAGVDHRMGDGIMVLFNDPLPCDDPAGEAVRLALAMRDRMEELCLKWKRLGHRLGFGVGISLGYATVGMVGYEGRYDYTASGTAVNIAARLCDHAEDGEILLSPRAWTAVEDRIATTSRGEVSFKGINREIEVMCIEPGTVLAQ